MKSGLLLGLLLCLACTRTKKPENSEYVGAIASPDTLMRFTTEPEQHAPHRNYDTLPDSAFVELIGWDSTFILDVRYATTNNFMKKEVYPCPKVLLRKVVAGALIAAHKTAKEKGYRIKIFDGYRPRTVQWQLWNATAKKQYVANPRYGSNHNRGTAVDLTLVEQATLRPVNMGTDYDFFGKKAHHSYTQLPDSVRKSRQLLKQIMTRHGFSPIDSEWWHYNFRQSFPLADYPLPCTP